MLMKIICNYYLDTKKKIKIESILLNSSIINITFQLVI